MCSKGRGSQFLLRRVAGCLSTICLFTFTPNHQAEKQNLCVMRVYCLPVACLAFGSPASPDHTPATLNDFCRAHDKKFLPIELGGRVPLRYDRAKQPPVGGIYHQWKGEQIPDRRNRRGCAFTPDLYKYFYCFESAETQSQRPPQFRFRQSQVQLLFLPCFSTKGIQLQYHIWSLRCWDPY